MPRLNKAKVLICSNKEERAALNKEFKQIAQDNLNAHEALRYAKYDQDNFATTHANTELVEQEEARFAKYNSKDKPYVKRNLHQLQNQHTANTVINSEGQKPYWEHIIALEKAQKLQKIEAEHAARLERDAEMGRTPQPSVYEKEYKWEEVLSAETLAKIDEQTTRQVATEYNNKYGYGLRDECGLRVTQPKNHDMINDTIYITYTMEPKANRTHIVKTKVGGKVRTQKVVSSPETLTYVSAASLDGGIDEDRAIARKKNEDRAASRRADILLSEQWSAKLLVC
jgi:hypothetical protein